MLVWHNHQWLEIPTVGEVSTLCPSPSLFETFAYRDGKVDGLADHFARLASALPHLQIQPAELYLGGSFHAERWAPILRKLMESAALREATVRLIVGRTPAGTLGEWLSVRPSLPTPAKLDLHFLDTVRDAAEWLPRSKTGPWLNSSAAWQELRQRTTATDTEGVQFNAQGHVVEATRSALAWYENGRWVFPAKQVGAVTSTTALQLQSVLRQMGQSFFEVVGPWPTTPQAILVLRATFHGGAVWVDKVWNQQAQLVWQAPPSPPAIVSQTLTALAQWRAQRSVSLA